MSFCQGKKICVTIAGDIVRDYRQYLDRVNREEWPDLSGETTERLLELARKGIGKDFHFISTRDTGHGDIPGKDYLVYTEYSHDEGQQSHNVYIKSKFAAENRVLAYREKGLDTSIYRAANMPSIPKPVYSRKISMKIFSIRC